MSIPTLIARLENTAGEVASRSAVIAADDGAFDTFNAAEYPRDGRIANPTTSIAARSLFRAGIAANRQRA
jgi:hypothetical protein